MVILAVTFEIDPNHVDGFREAILTQAENSRTKEPWCRQFDVCFDADDPTKCFLYEKYDDADSIPKHRSTEHFADYMRTVESWIVDKHVAQYEVVAG